MKNPKIELKRVKTFRGHDGVGLDCDLYVDGKKICHVFDSARGGENEYQAYGSSPEEYKTNNKIIQELEEYAKTLPPHKLPEEFGTRGGEEYPQSLGDIINNLLMDVEKEKFQKKMVKKFDTHIVVGIPGGDSITEYSYGKPVIKLSTIPKAKLQEGIDSIKAKLTDGKVILNTNLGAMGIII